ncbi:cytochrome P450 20A1 isoform X3 [Neomonachus schauinslandi]|uniref:Cytochrome P450 20A1 isoform X3 n=1 Tax=Neomonachus schauinslandi TaxID=29088 RepID=A0A8M1M8H3_NEOSC|nr:cytochrome P450 20A1 isoform X3 [Neomonachus schauinslandi]
MLKSLLRYQSSGANVSENHTRKKLYESGVTNSLQSNFALLLKLSEELLDKWLSYPESQHVPLGQHMLGFAMKSVTQMVMGSTFEDDQEVIHFQKNHGTILEDSMIFSLASCVITAKLCTWAICFLTTSEEVQKKLYEEIDQVLGKDPITPEKIEQLRYCRQVLCETVRTAKLTPVSARLQDVEGKIDKFIIPRETLVLYALGVVLQDPSTWPSPHKFDPDRFDDESMMKTFSLLGFSGAQECPELRFAYMVTTVLLSVLVRRLHLLSVEGQLIETKYELVTSPKEEAWITVSKRY